MWHSEKLFVMADTSTPSTPADDLSLSPITQANFTAKHTSEDQKKLIRRALSSGDNNLHIYVGQLPPLHTTQIRYRRKVRPHTRIPHAAHASVRCRSCPPHPQRPSDQCTMYCIQMLISSMTTYSLQYFTIPGWTTKKTGIVSSDGASSPMFVGNGGTSYTNRPST